MRPLRLVAALIALLGSAALAAPEKPVRIDSGLIAGTVEDGIAAWRGIPYAAPPIGPLRWREPQPVKKWTGVRQADAFSTTCMQASTWDLQPRSEDCLTLNVWAPAGQGGNKLPVMVWFHGGGLHSGSGSQALYLGDQLPRRGVILVTLNYRLGVFGYFSHPELTAESPFHTSGNQGLLDQVAALRWVHRNIAAFGGDPARVTIFGESAGSASVQALMTSPLTKGLFQAAIGESGGEARPASSDKGLAAAEKRGGEVGESLAALRALPAEELAGKPWQPTIIIDGRSETDGPNETYAAHRQRDVPLLVGWNADEGIDMAREGGDQSKIPFLQNLMGYLMWHWAGEQIADARSPAYAYYFLHVPPEPTEPCTYGCRAGHGAEIRYVFGHLDQDPRAWTAPDRALEKRILTYWTNFAKFHDPNGTGMPVWPRFDGKPDSVLRLGTEAEIAERGQFTDFAVFEKSLKAP